MGDIQKVSEIPIRTALAAFGDVQDDRIGRPPKLAQKAIALLSGKTGSRDTFQFATERAHVAVHLKVPEPEDFCRVPHSSERSASIDPLLSNLKPQTSELPRGFTAIELLTVIAIIGIMAAIVSLPLGNLQQRTAVRESGLRVLDTLRRAQMQAMAGHYGDGWGVHFSDSDGCSLPAKTIWVFRGGSFTSATDTSDAIDLPSGATVTSLAIGGGCDVKFARFDGSTTSAGTVTISDVDGATTTVSINAYGRISNP